VKREIVPRGLALLVLLSLSQPVAAQSLAEAAARERQRRDGAVAGASKVLTNDDLEKYALSETPGDAAAGTIDPSATGSDAFRQDPHWRHLDSAETYLKQCEERLTAARDRWLAAVEAGGPRAVEDAHRAVMAAGRALERARLYRDEAETMTRRTDRGRAGAAQ
jgi:hypothetical protein